MILTVKEVMTHSMCFVTWVTRPASAWQSLVTTVKLELSCAGQLVRMAIIINMTWCTPGRIWLSWKVWPQCPATVSSSSSTSVTMQSFREKGIFRRWCHVTLPEWTTGVGPFLVATSAHAGWTKPVSKTITVTVMRMTLVGVKTAVSSLTSQTYQYLSWCFGI